MHGNQPTGSGQQGHRSEGGGYVCTLKRLTRKSHRDYTHCRVRMTSHRELVSSSVSVLSGVGLLAVRMFVRCSG